MYPQSGHKCLSGLYGYLPAKVLRAVFIDSGPSSVSPILNAAPPLNTHLNSIPTIADAI